MERVEKIQRWLIAHNAGEISPMDNRVAIRELLNLYSNVKDRIKSRLLEFEHRWRKGTEEELFSEFVFCLLTPQSKAKSCWSAVEKINRNGQLVFGCENDILRELIGVRFKYTKAENIIRNRCLFVDNGKISVRSRLKDFKNIIDAREWLVENVKGMGYKEASHFLRNIGLGKDLAILDRHILKNLKLLNIIAEIPKSLSRKKYFDIENRMREFAEYVKIPLCHLDLLLWFKETGDIFK